LNLNTETGRLSSRRPNLQNQPALEKDPYKIRDAFIAEPGNTLIVADYGQLELRILAHVTNCVSMIDAFASGGCFHSRTAVGMYDYIREDIEKGNVLLEWDYSKGEKPPVPLVKDKYGSERRKAKTLNFSIAYGKTVHGLAEDWGIDKEEAMKTLEAWYRDRPEVKEWQEKTKKAAMEEGKVYTIMGRHRNLYDAMGYSSHDEITAQRYLQELAGLRKEKRRGVVTNPEVNDDDDVSLLQEKLKGINDNRRRRDHALRAAINTPIQVGIMTRFEILIFK
jgi:DNA polymerase-1